jgi:hypothetical protein
VGEKSANITAKQLAARFKWLQRFDDPELDEIAMCSTDERLEEGQEYFDISHPERGIIRGETGGQVPAGACYVARKLLSPRAWSKLTTQLH